MLCSFSELGISDDHSGIIELPADAPIGTDIREYLKLDDNTIEISVTPNRADCPGIIGVARDVAVLNKAPLNAPEITPVAATIDDVLPIQVDAPQALPALSGARGERYQRQSADAAVDEREAAPLRDPLHRRGG